MKSNIGSADKIVRVLLGVIIIAAGVFYQSWWGLIGLLPLLTASVNFCPAYSLLGISTKIKVKTDKIKI